MVPDVAISEHAMYCVQRDYIAMNQNKCQRELNGLVVKPDNPHLTSYSSIIFRGNL